MLDVFTIALQHEARKCWCSKGQADCTGHKTLAGWHVSQALLVPDGLHLLFLPPYSPELQPDERIFPLTNEALANRRFKVLNELQEIQAQRCVMLQDEPARIRALTHFHWWP